VLHISQGAELDPTTWQQLRACCRDEEGFAYLQSFLVNPLRMNHEAHFRALVQNASDIISILERDGTIRYKSPSITRILGYLPEAVVGRSCFDFIHPEDHQGVQALFGEDLPPGGMIFGQFRFLHHNGTWIYLEATGCNLTHEASIQGYVVNARDVTSRKQAIRALAQRNNQQELLRTVTQRIRQSLDLQEILSTTVTEVRALLGCDRVLVHQFEANGNGVAVVESVAPGWPVALGRFLADQWLGERLASYQKGLIRANSDILNTSVGPEHRRFLEELKVRANLVVPIFEGDTFWGLLVAHQCSAPRVWQSEEIDLMNQLADQLAIALYQSALYTQLQAQAQQLENLVQERTIQLTQAITFEAVLKRITDQVRDSLDESQILQTVVQELTHVTQADWCMAALYNEERTTATITYEYTPFASCSYVGLVIHHADVPEIYPILLKGECYYHARGTQASASLFGDWANFLMYPICNDQGVIGDLGLFYSKDHIFTELEIRLIHQVANQCAIALRQARLYQSAQAQLIELQKLDRLKDDFLSTVSHELRTPISNMKLSILLLRSAQSEAERQRYLDILAHECNREAALINDLLELQRVEPAPATLEPIAIQLPIWLPQVIEPYLQLAQQQQKIFTMDVTRRLPTLWSQPDELKRVLQELIQNACKYTPEGGDICLRVRRRLEYLQLTISNASLPIAPAEIGHLFDKFYRVPSPDPWQQSGTGLGLALVKHLVERLKGSIRAESGGGYTTFTLELPFDPKGLSPAQHGVSQ